jgi:L-histidine Nalpha-methyltransferase
LLNLHFYFILEPLKPEKHPTDRMTTFPLPAVSSQIEHRFASAVRDGLSSHPKRLPPWLFYDEAGSRLFDEITERPEYYLTRTERGILAANAKQIVILAAQPVESSSAGNNSVRLRITELGAGSADKTRLLLAAAVARQGAVVYEPVDVSSSALETARERIEREIAGVGVSPRVMDYTHEFELAPTSDRRLVLYIGSSIGNFDPPEAAELLSGVRSGLKSGDRFLLGVDLVKDEPTLLAAYDDAAGVTADFNLNLLARLNRELGANFDPETFGHRAIWNAPESRIEMHLESRIAQQVLLNGLDLTVEFAAGETIHTENSYKYRPGHVETMLSAAGFAPVESWTDERQWFSVCLACAK